MLRQCMLRTENSPSSGCHASGCHVQNTLPPVPLTPAEITSCQPSLQWLSRRLVHYLRDCHFDPVTLACAHNKWVRARKRERVFPVLWPLHAPFCVVSYNLPGALQMVERLANALKSVLEKRGDMRGEGECSVRDIHWRAYMHVSNVAHRPLFNEG